MLNIGVYSWQNVRSVVKSGDALLPPLKSDRGRNPSHRQVDTSDTSGYRRWLEVGSHLPKLWMYLDSTVLRRSTSEAAIHVFVSNGEIWPF